MLDDRRQTRTAVPFLDLAPSHAPIREALLAGVAALIDSGRFANGPAVAEFERAWAAYCGRRACVGVANGLDGLRLSLQALGIEPGDEVVVPAQTFVATWEAVVQAGGVPVPADIAEGDYCLDPDAAAAAIGRRTRFLMPVDLFGQVADTRALRALADRHGLALVEDACQAHGATRDGAAAGALADAAVFSHYPGKNLGAMGDAGTVVTDDDALDRRLRLLREHGQAEKYRHDAIGWTSRLDTLQALVLLHKLPLLDEWNEGRRRAAAAYHDALDGVGDIGLPPVAPGSEHVWHLFVVRTADPAGLAAHLAESGVGSGRHYPQPPHLTAAFRSLGHREGAFPVAERLARECLSLPIFPGITDEQVEGVVDAVASHFSG